MERTRTIRKLAPELVNDVGTRFSKAGWVCLVLLVITGAINLWYRGVGWAQLTTSCEPRFSCTRGRRVP